ncbi:major royal jelly family protein [Shewanella gelidimarina]|uniref:major royal jelly family protein n=1 Tax=Shewanella gelidimarina TaxID=56813 RepID=UPI00200FBF78|nr:major royal jelly family protein [Shewanella gelidimarina]MCL1058861.1 major royal jelly family protein [Shewanella gelidimarina]
MKSVAMLVAIGILGILIKDASANPLTESEVFAEVDGGVGGITFTSDDRVIFSYHPFYEPQIKVAELLPDGTTLPFPNMEWQGCQTSSHVAKNPDTCLNWVLGVRTDEQDKVWMLDSGQQAPRVEPKLVVWDTKTNQLDKIIHLPYPLSLPESQHNDFVISSRFQLVIIADEGIAEGPLGDKAALVVVDLKSGLHRRVLQGHTSVMPDHQRPIVVDKGQKNEKSIPVFVGVDGIALDKNQKWLYFAPLNKDKLYRIKMAYLADEKLSEKELAKEVEFYAYKPNNGGLSIDIKNNLYLTEVGERRIGIIPPDTRKYRPYSQDPRMIWPDGISYGNGGYLYTGAAQLPLSAPLNNGKASNTPPYYIFRFKPLAPGIQGR